MSQSDWNALIKDLDQVTEKIRSGDCFEERLQRLGHLAATLRLKRQGERTQVILSRARA